MNALKCYMETNICNKYTRPNWSISTLETLKQYESEITPPVRLTYPTAPKYSLHCLMVKTFIDENRDKVTQQIQRNSPTCIRVCSCQTSIIKPPESRKEFVIVSYLYVGIVIIIDSFEGLDHFSRLRFRGYKLMVLSW